MIWEFPERLKKMPLTTSIFINVLQSSGFSHEERLVREAVQNSVDAHRPESQNPVSIRFERKLLSGTEKGDLSKSLNLEEEPKQRLDLFDLPPGNALSSIDDTDDPLPVLIISDYYTHGLPGRWNGTEVGDHFGRLVVNLGIDDKAEGSEISTGGSYGFGKTVYGKASRIGIVAFYSVFHPSDKTEGCHARFMATGLFKVHDYENKGYTGFAFYGSPDPSNEGEAIPVVDEDAHALAEACGLTRRSPNDHGTTILIIDCDMNVEALKLAAEKYWWPRLVRNELDVIFIDEGKEIVPRPKKNADVIPFLNAYQNYVSETEDPPKSILNPFNKINTEEGYKRPGTLSCIALDTESLLANTVALIRAPGMVVTYRPAGSDSFVECIAVFHSHQDVEKILTYSEPQMHNEWDANADRLKMKFGDEGVDLVRRVIGRIDNRFRDFQRLQEPPVPPGGLHARELSKLLGRILDVKGVNPDQPEPSEPRPISIHVHEDRVQGDNQSVQDQAEIMIELKEDFEEDELECRVNVYHEVLGDSSHRLVTRSSCELRQNGETIAQGVPATATVTLTKDVPVTLQATATSDSIFLTRMKISVEEINE